MPLSNCDNVIWKPSAIVFNTRKPGSFFPVSISDR